MGDIYGRYGAAAAADGREIAGIQGLPQGAVDAAGAGSEADFLDPLTLQRQQAHDLTMHHAATALGQLAMLYYLHKAAGGQHSPGWTSEQAHLGSGMGAGDIMGPASSAPSTPGIAPRPDQMYAAAPRAPLYHSPLIERLAQMQQMFSGAQNPSYGAV